MQSAVLAPQRAMAGVAVRQSSSSRSSAALPARRTAVRVSAYQNKNMKGDSQEALPAFTRKREHLIGRVAALGLAAGLTGEVLTGAGPISQLHMETGISYNLLYVLPLLFGGWGLLGGLSPDSPTTNESNQRDVARRAPPVNPIKNPRRFLMQNDVAIGRLAMFGFLGAVLLEYLWGGEAPLAHLGLIAKGGQPLSSAPWYVLSTIALFGASGLGLFALAGDAGPEKSTY